MKNRNTDCSITFNAPKEGGILKESDVASTQFAAQFAPNEQTAIFNAELESLFSQYDGHMFKKPVKFYYPSTVEKISASACTRSLLICERYLHEGIQPRFIDVCNLDIPERFQSRVKVVEFRFGITLDFKPRLVYRVLDSFKHQYDSDEFLEEFVYRFVEDIDSPDQWQGVLNFLDKNLCDPALFNNLRGGIV